MLKYQSRWTTKGGHSSIWYLLLYTGCTMDIFSNSSCTKMSFGGVHIDYGKWQINLAQKRERNILNHCIIFAKHIPFHKKKKMYW